MSCNMVLHGKKRWSCNRLYKARCFYFLLVRVLILLFHKFWQELFVILMNMLLKPWIPCSMLWRWMIHLNKDFKMQSRVCCKNETSHLLILLDLQVITVQQWLKRKAVSKRT